MDHLGIDISKDKFDVCFHNKGSAEFKNDYDGFDALKEWLSKKEITELSCCMESTGKYGFKLATFLHEEGYSVSIVNPACIKAFAKSQMIRTKTDKIDAKLIAHYSETFELTEWKPKGKTLEKLVELTRRVRHLEKMKRSEENHLSAGLSSKTAIKSAETTIKFLKKEIKKLEEEISKTVDSDDELKENKELLTSIPGIGEKTAEIILSEIGGNVDKFKKASEFVAYSGITPSKKQSGTSLNTRGNISRLGNNILRTALYFPAIVAKQHNPVIVDFCKRLKQKGKAGKVIVCAAIRKLLHLIFGVLKSRKVFDGNYMNLAFSS